MSREIIFPASKSIMLRDVWMQESRTYPDEILLSVVCLKCNKPPFVTFDFSRTVTPAPLVTTTCDCNTIIVSDEAYMAALPHIDPYTAYLNLSQTEFILSIPSFFGYPDVSKNLKTWLSCQVGVPENEIDINFN